MEGLQHKGKLVSQLSFPPAAEATEGFKFQCKGFTAGQSQDFSIFDSFRMANMPETDDSQTDYVGVSLSHVIFDGCVRTQRFESD